MDTQAYLVDDEMQRCPFPTTGEDVVPGTRDAIADEEAAICRHEFLGSLAWDGAMVPGVAAHVPAVQAQLPLKRLLEVLRRRLNRHWMLLQHSLPKCTAVTHRVCICFSNIIVYPSHQISMVLVSGGLAYHAGPVTRTGTRGTGTAALE